MKKIKSNIMFIALLTVIILFFILKDDFNGVMDVLLNSDTKYILVAVLLIIASLIVRSIYMCSLIRETKQDYKMKNAILLVFETEFFNGITPFSLGGQPFQLYTLKKQDDIDYASGANILFKDFYSYQFALTSLGLLFLLVNCIFKFVNFSDNDLLRKFMILGFLINVSIVLFSIYVTYKKEVNHKFMDKIIIFLSKIKIIKNKEITINKIDNFVKKFKNQINSIKTNKKLMVKCYLLNILKLLLIGSIGCFCFKAIGVIRVEIMPSIVMIILIMVMASFIPIPGASGGMEFGFIAIFADYASVSELSAAMLLLRFISYYLLIIVGGIIALIRNRK